MSHCLYFVVGLQVERRRYEATNCSIFVTCMSHWQAASGSSVSYRVERHCGKVGTPGGDLRLRAVFLMATAPPIFLPLVFTNGRTAQWDVVWNHRFTRFLRHTKNVPHFMAPDEPDESIPYPSSLFRLLLSLLMLVQPDACVHFDVR